MRHPDNLDDCTARPGVPNLYGLTGGEANAIEPGKRMLSSMTPTIMLYESEPWLVVGTPGGSTIITTVLQVINNVVDYGMPLPDAVEAARVHHQWLPDRIFYEAGAIDVATAAELERRGHTLERRAEPSGRVDAVHVARDDNRRRVFTGWSDSRGYGTARGE